MSCTNPLYALRLGALNPETGKERIKILPRRIGDDYFSLCERHGKENIICLPCGKCKSCVESRSRSWALRCVLESALYDNNYFVTLTYDEKHVTNGLVKADAQKFIKRLRHYCPGLRYYLVGEYGGRTHRPHFHAILFNCNFNDLKFVYLTDEGQFFTSKTLNKAWPFGMSVISDVTFKSCAYVARYCDKKLSYNQGEFSLMSRCPGIGFKYFQDHYKEIYSHDLVVTQFGNIKPSRYFDNLLEKIDSAAIDEIKSIRINKSNTAAISDMLDHGFTYYEDLLKYKAEIKAKKFEALKRKGV